MSNNTQVTVSGIAPARTGKDVQYGNWFLIDQSGDFSIDKSITATIWLVGGGCDGTAGEWNGNDISAIGVPIPNTGTGVSYSGAGGDGGYVFSVMNVNIPKNQTLTSVIAERNNKSGTSLDIGGLVLNCDQSGYTAQYGGEGGSIPQADTDQQWADQSKAVLPGKGENGVNTPYGYVGSSGGGGAVCNGIASATNGGKGGTGAGSGTNHRSPGTSATNYGCGGGGGAICGYVAQGQFGGLGKQGCIIIAYKVDQPTFVIQKHYRRVCNTRKSCNADYYSNSSRTSCCGCGSGNSNGVSVADYTDSIHINTGKVK